MNRVFLAFSDMNLEVGKEYVVSHKDQIEAAGAVLDMQMSSDGVIFRLTVPEALAKVNPQDMLPDMHWMPVQGQVVPVQDEQVSIDALEGNQK